MQQIKPQKSNQDLVTTSKSELPTGKNRPRTHSVVVMPVCNTTEEKELTQKTIFEFSQDELVQFDIKLIEALNKLFQSNNRELMPPYFLKTYQSSLFGNDNASWWSFFWPLKRESTSF